MSNSTRPSSNSTSSTSSYDDRFVVPLEASRRGAHRARVSPVMAVLPVAAVVGIVIGAIALVYLFLGGLGDDNAGTTATTTAAPSTTASTSQQPTAESPTPGSTAAATGVIDKTVPLVVYNGTSPTVGGLARKVATKLTAGGWSVGAPETWTGPSVPGTTVYYGTESQRATALAVVKTLGHGTAKLSSSKAGTGIAVVVGNDYPGAGAGTAVHTTGTVRSTGPTKSPTAGASTTRSPGTSGTSGSTSTTSATSSSTTTSSST